MATSSLNTLECPRGCKIYGHPIASTIRGWKKHMSRKHGGYKESELAAILGAGPKESAQGKMEFLAEADKVVPLEGAQEPATPAPTTPAASMRTDAVSRKLSGRMNKFKKTIAEKFPQVISNALRDQPPGLQLSDDDRELLTEGVENSLDVLEVDFQVAPIAKTLTSPWWALIFPLFALLMVIVPKLPAIAEAIKAKQQKEQVENREESIPAVATD